MRIRRWVAIEFEGSQEDLESTNIANWRLWDRLDESFEEQVIDYAYNAVLPPEDRIEDADVDDDTEPHSVHVRTGIKIWTNAGQDVIEE